MLFPIKTDVSCNDIVNSHIAKTISYTNLFFFISNKSTANKDCEIPIYIRGFIVYQSIILSVIITAIYQ